MFHQLAHRLGINTCELVYPGDIRCPNCGGRVLVIRCLTCKAIAEWFHDTKAPAEIGCRLAVR